MSESEIIKVYQEGIQSVISLVQGLSTQISELSQTVSDLDARLKKLEKQSNQTSQNSSLPPSTDGLKKTKSLRQPSNKKTGGQGRASRFNLKNGKRSGSCRHTSSENLPRVWVLFRKR